MSHYNLRRVNPLLSRDSYLINNWGEIPRQASQELIFQNNNTGQFITTTDLNIKLFKRNRKFYEFFNTYYRKFKNDEISILIFIYSINIYKSPSIALKEIRKKMKKNMIQELGYIGLRDIGEKLFKLHFHIMLALTKINDEDYKKIMGNKRSKNYEFEFCQDIGSFTNYLTRKEIYAPRKKRSYFSSKQFKKI